MVVKIYYVMLFLFFLFFSFLFLLYNIVLFLPHINMNLPQAYVCSLSWTPLPPPVPSLRVIPVHQPQASCIKPGLAIRFLYDIIHISVPFPQSSSLKALSSSRVTFWSTWRLGLQHMNFSRYKSAYNHQEEWREDFRVPIILKWIKVSNPYVLLLFSHWVMSDSLQPQALQHTRLPCPSQSPGACSNSRPLSRWCHPNISSSVTLFSSCPQSFPASGVFSNESAVLYTWN